MPSEALLAPYALKVNMFVCLSCWVLTRLFESTIAFVVDPVADALKLAGAANAMVRA